MEIKLKMTETLFTIKNENIKHSLYIQNINK